MRDWLWLALFPGPMGVRSMSKGEWRSFWERLFARVKAEFSPGGQGRTAELLEQAATQNGGTAAEALAAAEQSVAHRRAQTQAPSTRAHAAYADLALVQDMSCTEALRRNRMCVCAWVDLCA